MGGLFSATAAAHLPDTRSAVLKSMGHMLLCPEQKPKTALGAEGYAPAAWARGPQHQDQNPRG